MNKIKNKLSVWIPVFCLFLITSFALEALAHESECPEPNQGCDSPGDNGFCAVISGGLCCLPEMTGDSCGLPETQN